MKWKNVSAGGHSTGKGLEMGNNLVYLKQERELVQAAVKGIRRAWPPWLCELGPASSPRGSIKRLGEIFPANNPRKLSSVTCPLLLSKPEGVAQRTLATEVFKDPSSPSWGLQLATRRVSSH